MRPVDPKLRLTVFLLAFFAIWSIRATCLAQVDGSIQSPETRIVFSTLVKASIWIASAAFFGYWARGENPIRYLGLSRIPQRKIVAIGFFAILVFCISVFLFEGVIGRKGIDFRELTRTGILPGAAFFLVSPLVEEIFFRGLVYKELAASMRPVFSNLVSSLLFVGIHLPYWISSGVQMQNGARMAVGVLLFSLFAGWLYSMSKSIWPPTAAHIANNIVSSLLHPGK